MLCHSGTRFLETIAKWRVVRPDLKVVVTGAGADDPTILNVISCGAKGYVDEAAPTPQRSTLCIGARYGFRVAVMSMVIECSVDLLSAVTFSLAVFRPPFRQRKVLPMLVEGQPNREIGRSLGIKERTVKAHG